MGKAKKVKAQPKRPNKPLNSSTSPLSTLFAAVIENQLKEGEARSEEKKARCAADAEQNRMAIESFSNILGDLQPLPQPKTGATRRTYEKFWGNQKSRKQTTKKPKIIEETPASTSKP